MRLSTRLLALVPGVRWRLAGLIALLLVSTLTYILQGLLIAQALAGIFAGESVTTIVRPVALVVVLQVARSLLIAVREVAALRTSGLVKRSMRKRLSAKLLELGPGWLQRTRTGSVQSTLVDGVEMLDPYIGRFLPQVVAAVLSAAGVTVFLAAIEPLIGLIVLACAAVTPILPLVSRRLFHGRMSAWFDGYRGLYAESLDAIQGMATLKSFNASARRGAELHVAAQDFCRDSVRLVGVVVVYVGVVAFAVAAGTAAAVGIGALRLASGELVAIELLIILLLTREAFRPLSDLEKAYHASYSARTVGEKMFELLDADPELAPATAARPASAATPNGVASVGVVFDAVTFAYRYRNRPALHDLDLEVAAGERVAIVGRSGAGKTTIASLLLRFFEPDHGRVLVGGTDIRELPLEELRANVAVVAQDTYLFHGSVRRNLLLARPDASADDLETACRAASAHDFIAALPDGYGTVVGERGLKLSGGQRQRIAIARALLKDAPILLLDEATSSIDGVNEADIQHALERLTAGRTTLVIAHRLSTVQGADRIVVLEAGRLVETGAPDALLTAGGAYAELVAAQEVSR